MRRPALLDPPDNRPTSAPDRFVPRHCPHPDCHAHDGTGFRFYRHGRYRRLAAPRSIPRFRCRTCRRTFSSQTFSTTYCLKRPELLEVVAKLICNGECDRHALRTVDPNARYTPHRHIGAAQSTITRLVPRLGRHAALVLAELAAPITEPLAADDFETFSRTQLVPVAVPTVVGRDTGYVYALDQAAHRRGGRLTPAQQAKLVHLEARGALPDPRARAAAWERVADVLCALVPEGGTLSIASDGATAIAQALADPRFKHEAFPNPERGPKGSPRSAEAVIRDASLLEVDLLHKWFRHSTAHDRRETIAQSRSTNALFSRKLIFALAKNTIQLWRQKEPKAGTPAVRRGLLPRPLSWRELLERRRFIKRTPALAPGIAAAYFETISTLGTAPSARRLPRRFRA